VSDHPGGPSGPGRFKRRRAARIPDGATAPSLQEVLAELVLLREENARLSAAAHEPPSLGRLVGRARSLGGAQANHDDSADEATQMFVEGVVLRESLLEVCRELEHSIAAVKARLDRMDAGGDSIEDVVGGTAGGG
jgi:hypothetical protein